MGWKEQDELKKPGNLSLLLKGCCHCGDAKMGGGTAVCGNGSYGSHTLTIIIINNRWILDLMQNKVCVPYVGILRVHYAQQGGIRQTEIYRGSFLMAI